MSTDLFGLVTISYSRKSVYVFASFVVNGLVVALARDVVSYYVRKCVRV
jgi:hypothetical protein